LLTFSYLNWSNIINISAIGLGLATILIPFSLNIIGCYLLVLFIGFFSMLGEAPLMTTIQRHIPDEEAGRIYAAVDSIIIGSMGIGSFYWLVD
jgi:DHA3 family macrolide efflux protein-like MFS transporter